MSPAAQAKARRFNHGSWQYGVCAGPAACCASTQCGGGSSVRGRRAGEHVCGAPGAAAGWRRARRPLKMKALSLWRLLKPHFSRCAGAKWRVAAHGGGGAYSAMARHRGQAENGICYGMRRLVTIWHIVLIGRADSPACEKCIGEH